MSPKRALVIWYGLWQAGHLVFNAVGLATGGASARDLLAAGLPEAAWRTMWVSWAMDFCFASPLGVLYAVRFLWGPREPVAMGLASLTAAVYSAALCYWVQWVHAGRLLLDTPAQWLGLLSFVPCVVLFGWLLLESLRGSKPGRAAGP